MPQLSGGANARHQRRAQAVADERQAGMRVRCMPMLDRLLLWHEARDAAFRPQLQAVSNAGDNRRAHS
jgi:hypothetical protein